MRTMLAIAGLAAILAAQGCGPSVGGPGPATPEGGGEGEGQGEGEGGGNIPDIMLDRVDGQGSVRLHDIARDRVVVVVFWSTYCDSCKTELVGLKALYGELASKGLEVLAVSMDKPDTASDVLSDVQKYSLPYLVAYDTESRASSSLNPTNAQPFTVIIDKGMNIVWTRESFFPGDMDKIEEVVREALGLKDGASAPLP